MLEPLRQWYCDVCGECIERPEDGYVIWQNDEERKSFDFTVIHKTRCDRKQYPCSAELDRFLGTDGLTYLLTFLSCGPLIGGESKPRVRDLNEFVDFMRRVQTPCYEDARRRFDEESVQADWAGASEIAPYTQDALRRIAENSDRS